MTSIVFAAEHFGHGTMGLFDGRFDHRDSNCAGPGAILQPVA